MLHPQLLPKLRHLFLFLALGWLAVAPFPLTSQPHSVPFNIVLIKMTQQDRVAVAGRDVVDLPFTQGVSFHVYPGGTITIVSKTNSKFHMVITPHPEDRVRVYPIP